VGSGARTILINVETEQQSVERASTAAMLTALLVVIVLGIGLFLLIKDLYPEELTTKADPDVIDSIFGNKVVVLFARLYIIASTAVRMTNQDWFGADEGVKVTVEQQKRLLERVNWTRERNRRAILAAERRSSRLDRAAERSIRVVERATRKLRQGV
jgi:hypothetical protein